MRPLNDAERRFLTFGASTEDQDGLSERAGNNDFVMNVVVCKTMHGPADACFLTIDHTDRRRVFLRQPGEGRNLRMGHSVRHEQLIALAVVGNRFDLSELQAFITLRRAAYGPNGRYVTVRVYGIGRRR